MDDGLLLYGSRIVVPSALQKDTIEKIHFGHQGIERCLQRVRSSVWWPGVNAQIRQKVLQCLECVKHKRVKREPFMSTSLPDYPWQMVAADLFELNGAKYLTVVDYFSRFPEVVRLSSTTSTVVIATLKSMFARFGIPEVVRSDNGPQFSSLDFAQFANWYRFLHVTSSPRYPQSNGLVERTVQTIKQLFKKTPNDPQMALLTYRATPLPWCGLSPAELLMGRRIRTPVPVANCLLVPEWSYLNKFRKQDLELKEREQRDYNARHKAQERH